MEGLVFVHPTPFQCSHVRLTYPLFPLPREVEKGFFKFRTRTMKHCRSSTLVTATLKPLHEASVDKLKNLSPSEDVLQLWQNADAVCFDVDSTVCLDEGIDELAEFCGAGKAVAEWTSRAMTGSVPFEEALTARLSIFKPSLAQVREFLEKNPPRISPGMDQLVKKLNAKNVHVYLVSGGFRQMIHPVAERLGIPESNIFGNRFLFGNNGEFIGFDVSEPTSRSGGKATAVEKIRKAGGYGTLVMIGDGATDLEARKPGGADMFVCYAGVQHRSAVAEKSDWLVFSFDELMSYL